MPLSAGTSLVSLYRLDIKGLEDFRWIEDGEVEVRLPCPGGLLEDVPAELEEIMEHIGDDWDLHRGPGLLLIERLTGIRLTPEILDESRFLSGVLT